MISSNVQNPEGAEEFLAFMVSDPGVQAGWTKGQGALSANMMVDPSEYNSVMQKANATVAAAGHFAFNYDLATPPPVAEVGLSMFAEFMDDPSRSGEILKAAAARGRRSLYSIGFRVIIDGPPVATWRPVACGEA